MSDRRVGWIEAKKQCEARKAHLVSFEFVSKQADILKWVGEKTRRRRGKFWTGGNDIQVCTRFKQDQKCIDLRSKPNPYENHLAVMCPCVVKKNI